MLSDQRDRFGPPDRFGKRGGGAVDRFDARDRDRDRERTRDASPARRRSHSRSLSPEFERQYNMRKRSRVSGWDVPPTAEQLAAQRLALIQGQTGAPIPPPMPMPNAPSTSGTIHPSRQQQLPFAQSFNGGAPANGSGPVRQAKRLYVGNLPVPVGEAELKTFFSRSYSAAHPRSQPECVTGIYLNLEKKFAFIEWRTPEEATIALNTLDGLTLRGQQLKLRRPTDYDPIQHAHPPIDYAIFGVQPHAQYNSQRPHQSNAPSSAAVSSATGLSNQVADGPNKLFCGGLPYTLTESEVVDLLSSFGQLRAFHLVRNRENGQSKGYCFFEYLDPSVSDNAISTLSTIAIGDRGLSVRRAHRGAEGGDGGYDAALHQHVPRLTSPSTPPTPVLVLMNMVTAADLVNDDEYNDILYDVQSELNRYGRIVSIEIPRPTNGAMEQRGVGKVFVEFSSVQEAMTARGVVEGRKFADKIVQCDFIDINKYRNRDW
ncbi:unnamed protein product [Sphagnum balticum]